MDYFDKCEIEDIICIDKKLAGKIGLSSSIVYYTVQNAIKEHEILIISAEDMKYIQEKYLPFFSLSTIKRTVNKLIKLGYLKNEEIKAEDVKKYVIKNKNNPRYICEWCGCGCNAINEHHYPIPKVLGGKEVVKICPNCHYEFHSLYKEYKK